MKQQQQGEFSPFFFFAKSICWAWQSGGCASTSWPAMNHGWTEARATATLPSRPRMVSTASLCAQNCRHPPRPPCAPVPVKRGVRARCRPRCCWSRVCRVVATCMCNNRIRSFYGRNQMAVTSPSHSRLPTPATRPCTITTLTDTEHDVMIIVPKYWIFKSSSNNSSSK